VEGVSGGLVGAGWAKLGSKTAKMDEKVEN